MEHIETHAAHVFLCGDRAFKIKKQVKFPYLYFSKLTLRRAILQRELEINRAFAPGIYMEVAETLGEPVLVMQRFAAEFGPMHWQPAPLLIELVKSGRSIAQWEAAQRGSTP